MKDGLFELPRGSTDYARDNIVVQKYRYNEFMGPLEMSSKICSFMPLSSDKKKSITYSSLYENLIHHPESQSSPGIAHLTLSPETP